MDIRKLDMSLLPTFLTEAATSCFLVTHFIRTMLSQRRRLVFLSNEWARPIPQPHSIKRGRFDQTFARRPPYL